MGVAKVYSFGQKKRGLFTTEESSFKIMWRANYLLARLRSTSWSRIFLRRIE